jgi:hypothetical protein
MHHTGTHASLETYCFGIIIIKFFLKGSLWLKAFMLPKYKDLTCNNIHLGSAAIY